MALMKTPGQGGHGRDERTNAIVPATISPDNRLDAALGHAS